MRTRSCTASCRAAPRVIPARTVCFAGRLLLENEPQTAAGTQFARAAAYLDRVLEDRRTGDPQSSYVARLYRDGVDKIGKKIGEEATEVVIAAKNDSQRELVWESADLLFHLIVLLKHAGVSLDEVGAELLSRAR